MSEQNDLLNNTDDGLKEDNVIELMQGQSAQRVFSNKLTKEIHTGSVDDKDCHVDIDDEDRPLP